MKGKIFNMLFLLIFGVALFCVGFQASELRDKGQSRCSIDEFIISNGEQNITIRGFESEVGNSQIQEFLDTLEEQLK